jgi:hypothetical protein
MFRLGLLSVTLKAMQLVPTGRGVRVEAAGHGEVRARY